MEARGEPDWWQTARDLRAQGLSWRAIAARVGRAQKTVRMAVDRAQREREREYLRRYWQEARSHG
jgi:transposase